MSDQREFALAGLRQPRGRLPAMLTVDADIEAGAEQFEPEPCEQEAQFRARGLFPISQGRVVDGDWFRHAGFLINKTKKPLKRVGHRGSESTF